VTDYIAAATARRERGTQRSHRPSERRSQWRASSGRGVSFRSTVELRSAATQDRLHFVGLASAYDAPYEMWDWAGPYTEVVRPGAGADTLAMPGLDVPLVLGHDSLRRIARTTNGSLILSEIDAGLEVDAPDLDPNDSDVAYIAPKIRSGLVDEMSFMFTIVRGTWSPDYTQYDINAYDIHRGDVSVVGYGANPATQTELRSRHGSGEAVRLRTIIDLALAPR
jgi:HK97 family phage prohead protease